MSDQNLRSQVGPYFGEFGGRFVPESLIAALDELEATYNVAKSDPSFAAELAGGERRQPAAASGALAHHPQARGGSADHLRVGRRGAHG